MTRFGPDKAPKPDHFERTAERRNRTMEQNMSTTQQGNTPQPQPQQQGQTSPAPQQTAGTPAQKPVIRDWAAI